jgi:hypothetical protein
MSEELIKTRIAELRNRLTGDIFQDGETQQAIYELKKQLNPEIESNPMAEVDDEGCLYCGS